MNRTVVLLIAFLLLGGGVFWYLSQGGDEKTTLAGADRAFKVEDIEQVHKIFIADRRGERTTLERRDNQPSENSSTGPLNCDLRPSARRQYGEPL